MNIILLGAAGFIGTNLIYKLACNLQNTITAVDVDLSYFCHFNKDQLRNVKFVRDNLDSNSDVEQLLQEQDVVYHLVSKSTPSKSNKQISVDIAEGIEFTAAVLDACISCHVKKVIFISSGGTVYGKNAICPIPESSETFPISSYGVQKLTIEKLLYLYQYLYGVDYRIIRLANPYGPYQRPNGSLGVVTTFIYKALTGQEIMVYGDGSVVRDFIYIDDAVNGIVRIANAECSEKIYNLGSGIGTSIKEVIAKIQYVLGGAITVCYQEARNVDVPSNFLDVSRYEKEFGTIGSVPLEEGIIKTAAFLKNNYQL